VERPRRDDVLALEIEDLAFGGAGVARFERFVVFCRDTAPGDLARMRITKARRRYAEADLVEVLRPGPDRVVAPCPYVPRCGGCRLQHLDYAAALAAKRDQVGEHLVRIGHLPGVEVREPDPAVAVYGYRNKMEYSVAPGTDGAAIGMHARGRWDEVVDLRACLLATPLGNAVRESVRAWAVREEMAPYDQRAQAGDLRHVVVREGIATGQVLVTVVTSPGLEERVDRLAGPLAEAHPELVGLLHGVNEGVAEVTTGLPTRVVAGRDWLEERVMGVTLRLSASAFFQTNTGMTDTLYGRVAEAAGLDGSQVLYDLFAGAGSIGIALAGGARQVVAVEISDEATADAERNARANGVANHTAVAGDVGVVLRDRGDRLPPPDVVVVDPPRAGLAGRAVRRILELGAPTLVYVSCQPATFADNASRFVEGGYRLEWVRPVDMFPQTPHIESVARFTREPAAPPGSAASADGPVG
jgi:23S rRNA (uracil1939-C5)-methyltransferase